MEKDLNMHKCPSCGMSLTFNPKTQKLSCSSCGNDFDIEVVESIENAEGESTEFDWGDYKKNLTGEDLDNSKVYICNSCGAQIMVDATTSATVCPYCDSAVILNDRVTENLKPNGIIPFKFEKKDLAATVQKFYKKKPFLPKNFFSENKLENAQGIYVPFWLFDCSIQGEIDFKATRTTSYVRGDYRYTTVSHYYLEREGGMSYKMIPVDGSIKMDNDLMDSIEPFDFSEIVDFDDRYLSGYVSDRFDGDPDSEKGRAETRVVNTTIQTFADDANFLSPVLVSNKMKIVDSSVKYVLLPVYLFNSTYNGKTYRYAVNGQTGKCVGELPVSKLKKFLYFLASFLISSAVGTLILGLLSQA